MQISPPEGYPHLCFPGWLQCRRSTGKYTTDICGYTGFSHPYESTYLESGMWIVATCLKCGNIEKIVKVKDVHFEPAKHNGDPNIDGLFTKEMLQKMVERLRKPTKR